MLARAAIFRASIHTPKTFFTDTATTKIYTPTRLRFAMAAPTDTQAAAEANTSGVSPDSISATLRSKLDASHVEIEDMSGKLPLRLRQDLPSHPVSAPTTLLLHKTYSPTSSCPPSSTVFNH